MTIEKRPSGKYRIKQMYQGVRYTVTVDHKPNNAEAVRLIADAIEKAKPNVADMTFRRACEAYIEAKRHVLSPTTIREYSGYLRTLPASLLDARLMQITTLDIQKVVSEHAASHAPKTTANVAHFIMAVLKASDIDIKPPKLPQKEKKAPYIPTKEEMKAILAEIKKPEWERYYIPLNLAMYGLRRSEICALTIDDLDGNVLTISKAKVQNEDKEWVIKTTKTVESTRTIVISDELADRIREQGYIFKGDPGTIYKNLQRIQKKLGIPPFQLHKIRHFYASYLHDLGYTDKQIQEVGGWRTDVMKTVYQHAMEVDEAKKSMACAIQNLTV